MANPHLRASVLALACLLACSCRGSETRGACADLACENGGRCSVRDGAEVCDCPLAFEGATCAEPAAQGLEERPSNTSCVAFARPSSTGPLRWVARGTGGASGLDLMMRRQSPSGHWYEIYRTGQVYVVGTDGVRSAAPLVTLDVHVNGEMGLLGLALHPGFESAPHLYVYYTRFVGTPGASNVEVLVDRFTVTGATTTPAIVPGSRTNVFRFDRGAGFTNHLGGTIEFDPLAPLPTLYLALGDGGGGHSTCNLPSPADSANGNCKAQYLATYHGKLLRFDVSDTSTSAQFEPEIVGLGLRNPFRWSFDRETGDLYIGDVGEGSWEEVSRLPRAMLPSAGGTPVNFGWPCFEGFAPFASGTLCAGVGTTLAPIHAYDHSEGVSVIGGRVYRGDAIAGLDGTYVFNDIFAPGNGPPWRLVPNAGELPSDPADDFERIDIGDSSSPRGFVAYTEDVDGELWAFTTWGGVYRLETEVVGTPPPALPPTLSATGCFDLDGEPVAGLIPFDVRAPLWSDGAQKRRWLAIPDGTQIGLDADGDFEFPVGTVLAKEFTHGGVRIETRLFVRHPDGTWAGYTYAWADADGLQLADAELVGSASSTRDVPGTALDWQFPSRGQCLSCHTSQAGFSLGLEVAQLNSTFAYPAGTSANQLHTLTAIGVLDPDASSYRRSDALPTYEDVTEPVARRAHAYLHSNCSSCHRPGASGFGGRSNMPDLRSRLGVESDLASLLCDRTATAEHLGLGAGALLVEPGVPGDWADLAGGGSVLYLRMAARDGAAGDGFAMPPIGTRVADQDTGLSLVSQFVAGLTCP